MSRPRRDEIVRPYVKPESPVERIFGAEDDRKGWGRASVTLNTRPLRRFLRVSQADLLLPNRQNPLRLAADCVAIGAIFALLAFFPLLLVALAVTVDLRMWIVVGMGVAGFLGRAYVFFRAWSPDTTDLDRF